MTGPRVSRTSFPSRLSVSASPPGQSDAAYQATFSPTRTRRILRLLRQMPAPRDPKSILCSKAGVESHRGAKQLVTGGHGAKAYPAKSEGVTRLAVTSTVWTALWLSTPGFEQRNALGSRRGHLPQ